MDLLHKRTQLSLGRLSFSLSLHFPLVYFGQLVARSHSAAVPMVIAAEIANGEEGGAAAVVGLTENGRDSVALFEEIGDCVAVTLGRGGVRGGEGIGGCGVESVGDA